MNCSKFVCDRKPNEMSFAERLTAHHGTTEAEIMIWWRCQQTYFWVQKYSDSKCLDDILAAVDFIKWGLAELMCTSLNVTEELPKNFQKFWCALFCVFLLQSNVNDWNVNLLEQQSSVKLLYTAFVTHIWNWVGDSSLIWMSLWNKTKF